ncbi:MAG TPA: porin [Burkholderiales bacterium]|nr:porin [Burkholderiales bacterium]
MNKKLMAVAVAGALAAPGLAVAQVGSSPGVTLYGRLDEALVNTKYSANGAGTISEVTKRDIWSAGNAMGVRGREDLGGGTAAWFQLETGVWPDGRLDSASTSGQHFGGRNSGLGLSSSWGEVMFGIWDTPYKVAMGTWNSLTSGGFSAAGIILGNGDSTGALNNALCQTTLSNTSGSIGLTAPALNSCVTEATANGTAFSRRINNSVQYWSPVTAGVQFRLMTAMANYQSPDTSPGSFASGTPKPQEYSASVNWARGPLSVGAAYDTHKGLRPGTVAGQDPNPKDNAFSVGGKWNFGPGEAGAAYEQLKYNDNGAAGGATGNNGGMKVPAFVVNGRVNAGPGAVWASYSKTQGGKSCSTPNMVIGSAACGVQAKQTTVGYDYVLSKRTKAYVVYNKIDNGFNGTVGTNYYYIAGPAGNNANGTASGVVAGTDVTTLGLGIQHVF